MVHGNVRISSVFVNRAGEWKLGGFELLSSMKEESPVILVINKFLFVCLGKDEGWQCLLFRHSAVWFRMLNDTRRQKSESPDGRLLKSE